MKERKIETVETFRDEQAGVEVCVTMNPEIPNPLHRYMLRPRSIIKPKNRDAFSISGFQPDFFQPTYGTVEHRVHRTDRLVALILEAEEYVEQRIRGEVEAEAEQRRINDEKRAKPRQDDRKSKLQPRIGKTERDRQKKRAS